MKSFRVLIIDPSRLSREGLRLLLSDPPYKVEDAASFDEYVALSDTAAPELIIWCAGVPISAIKSGIVTCLARFNGVAEPIRHVVLASAPHARAVRRLEAMEIDALLLVDISGEVLNRSLELVMLGQRLFPAGRKPPSGVAQAEVLAFPGRHGLLREVEPQGQKHEVVLSGREGQILRLLVAGASNKAIARDLLITEATVKVHIKGLLRKIRVANRTQAAIWALHNGYRVIGEDDVPQKRSGS